MAFKKPDNLGDLSIEELQALNEEAIAEGREITATDGDLTDEQIARAEELMQASDEIESLIETATAAETERADRIARLRDGFKGSDDKDDDADGDKPNEGDEADEDADEHVDEGAKETVTASAVARARRFAPAPKAPKVEVEEVKPNFSIVASANVPGVEHGAAFAGMLDTAKAFEARSRGFVAGTSGDKPKVKNVMIAGLSGELEFAGEEYTLSDRHQRYGVAQVRRAESEFVVTERMSQQDQYDTIMEAAKRARLGDNSLVAAGGWCAPSEQVYGFLELEEVSGILDLPTVTAKRGGISFTKGPDYASLAASWGFLQTEAQAISGTAKTCYSLTCPTWTDIRLDAVGFCVTAPVLTNAGFPELTNRVLQIGTVAHAHKVNASVIDRISTYIGTAIDWAEVGGTTSDILDAAALQATRLRYQYAMSESTIIEAVFPVWAKEVVRADLSRRNGLDLFAVTDQQINAFFAVRRIRVQWVFDYQPLLAGAVGTGAGTGTWTSFPTKLQFMMYPAGAYTKLTKDVIDLDTIYDSAGLGVNNYTAAFYEEGIAVANTGATGVKVEVLVNVKGLSGYPAVGAGAGVSIP